MAKRAGVSIATVSRAVNGISTVDPELAKRVWQAINEVGYLPNTQARALVSGRSRMLGLIVSEITNPFFPELVQEFENLAVAQGYEVLIGSTNYELERTESLIRRMLQRNVDGVAVYFPPESTDGERTDDIIGVVGHVERDSAWRPTRPTSWKWNTTNPSRSFLTA